MRRLAVPVLVVLGFSLAACGSSSDEAEAIRMVSAGPPYVPATELEGSFGLSQMHAFYPPKWLDFLKRMGLPDSQMTDEMLREWEPLLAEYGLEIPTSVGQALEELHFDMQSVLTKGYTPATAVLKWLLGGTVSVVGAIVAALIVPVFAFYLLYDFDVLVAKAGELIPPRLRPAPSPSRGCAPRATT